VFKVDDKQAIADCDSDSRQGRPDATPTRLGRRQANRKRAAGGRDVSAVSER